MFQISERYFREVEISPDPDGKCLVKGVMELFYSYKFYRDRVLVGILSIGFTGGRSRQSVRNVDENASFAETIRISFSGEWNFDR